jgi:predicted acetyltransferase
MSITLRTITDDEVPAFLHAVVLGFGGDVEGDDRGAERLRQTTELGRTYAAFDGSRIVGTSSTFSLELAVPGGRVAMGGFTMATVSPTHRRQGILREMMSAHLREVRARGEPLSGLWASEAPIYGRFGYGVAAEGDQLAFTDLELPAPASGDDDRIELIDDELAAELLPRLHERIAMRRPGALARTQAWWKHRCFDESPARRQGASARRQAVAMRGDSAVGYAVYRQRPSWQGAVADGTLELVELTASDLQAELSLWRMLASVDLFPRVKWWNAPVDVPLPWLALDRRRLTRTRTDTLWLRVCDVQAALEGRAYGGDGALILAVDDPIFPDNARTYELTVEEGRGACVLSTQPAELQLDIRALSSLYLGGVAPSQLARAGQLTGGPGVLARADRLFSWPEAPWCPEIF